MQQVKNRAESQYSQIDSLNSIASSIESSASLNIDFSVKLKNQSNQLNIIANELNNVINYFKLK
jgi:methyl-accepting chemotaxis protein